MTTISKAYVELQSLDDWPGNTPLPSGWKTLDQQLIDVLSNLIRKLHPEVIAWEGSWEAPWPSNTQVATLSFAFHSGESGKSTTAVLHQHLGPAAHMFQHLLPDKCWVMLKGSGFGIHHCNDPHKLRLDVKIQCLYRE
jgi:hypothetical protein